MKLNTIIKPLDIVIFFLAVVIAIFSIFRLTQNNNKSPLAYIDTPNGSYVYSLDSDRSLEFSGPLGITKITIKNGEAFFTDSPCQNKICIMSNPAKQNGDWIACLPNRIFLRIEGTDNSESTSGLDAISE
ncbi:MAG: hypothetical protein BKP49_07625 [Treponema sp. CETP13]|nr:MAG: hypothetical protein BKP49_07625 [Treponema sp. CETP13]